MKRIFLIVFALISSFPFANAFTQDIGKTNFSFDVGSIFPTPRDLPTDAGIDNVSDYIVAMIPLLTTLMAV
ncbi:hypothetical protein H6768_01260 [Candidatus Peribacteria bacterium]|nr:hypothetical protein [Candidatus Peribacteria bacterium]